MLLPTIVDPSAPFIGSLTGFSGNRVAFFFADFIVFTERPHGAEGV
jgi:hypothetical protein